jgi:hypothetical protein
MKTVFYIAVILSIIGLCIGAAFLAILPPSTINH